MSDKFTGYVIAYKDEPNQYLDHYEGNSPLHNAVMYHSYDDAEADRKNIDVAYLYEVRAIEVQIK